jgi:hypothetical protein
MTNTHTNTYSNCNKTNKSGKRSTFFSDRWERREEREERFVAQLTSLPHTTLTLSLKKAQKPDL